MTTGNLQIHSENILPIIKKWLYSDKDIFVRELVSNACDALQKVRILQDQGEIKDSEELRIDIHLDKEAKTLTFSDTGIGMTADEVEKYIAQIAFSGAEEFVEKYKTKNEKDQFIGHFGLGFYSAYMVAAKVDINTLSYKPDAKPVFWSCDGSSEYVIETGTRTKRGTDITLHIDAENDEFLEHSKIKNILKQYCSFLPFPVYFGTERINPKEPLWIKTPSECSPQDYLEFYRHLYPMQEDPLFWVHLNADYPFHLKGILYFPRIKRNFDLNKNTVQLYCNRVFVSDNCKDVIPEYLMPLRGVLDSPDIPLNVSRSYLQMDRTVRQLASHISKKVCDSLTALYKNDREKFIEAWEDVALIAKIGCIEDDKFYSRAKEFLIWKTTDGNWETVEAYLEKNKEKTKDKVLYTGDASHNVHLLDVYKQKGIEVLCANSPVDNYLINFLEKKITPAAFQRIDAAIDEHLLDASREKSILDAEGKTESGKLAEFIKSKLNDEQVDIEAKSLAADSMPGFIMVDENQRRLKEYLRSIDPTNTSQAHMMTKRTFVVNTNSGLLASIQKLDAKHPELAKEMVNEVYQLALLSQREMDANHLNEFITRTNHILEKLVKTAADSS
jgi:molecular chaperone HtpG